MFVQRFEDRKRGQRLAAILLKHPKRIAERTARTAIRPELLRPKAPEQRFQHRALDCRDGGIIDKVGGSGRGNRFGRRQRPYRRILGKAGHSGHVDVEVIEKGAARRRIGAQVPRLGGKQRVQRIDPDCRGAKRRRIAAEPREVGEIADSPIPAAAQTIELSSQAPAAHARLQFRMEIAGGGSDDQTDLRLSAAGSERQAVIAERERRRQR